MEKDKLKPTEFSPLDYVLVKKSVLRPWELFQYARGTDEYHIMVGDVWLRKDNCQVIHYNEGTKHLLGTKN